MTYYPPRRGATVVYRPKTRTAILAYVRLHERVWWKRVEEYLELMYGLKPSGTYRLMLKMEQGDHLRYARGVVSMD